MTRGGAVTVSSAYVAKAASPDATLETNLYTCGCLGIEFAIIACRKGRTKGASTSLEKFIDLGSTA
jgi:hypothetical protein